MQALEKCSLFSGIPVYLQQMQGCITMCYAYRGKLISGPILTGHMGLQHRFGSSGGYMNSTPLNKQTAQFLGLIGQKNPSVLFRCVLFEVGNDKNLAGKRNAPRAVIPAQRLGSTSRERYEERLFVVTIFFPHMFLQFLFIINTLKH